MTTPKLLTGPWSFTGGFVGGKIIKPPPKKGPGKPSLGSITFVSFGFENRPAYQFTCLLGDGSPTVLWAPNWQPVARERERSVTEWHGNDPMKISIPILFDNFANSEGRNVEQDIRYLEIMSGMITPASEPPIIAFDSGGVVPHDAHDNKNLDWVIESIEWGDADRNNEGNRTRQAATVTVMEFVEDANLLGLSPAKRKKAKKKKATKRKGAQKKADQKRYVVKAGNETLQKIAAKKLGKASRWVEIKKLNPKYRDPKKVLPIGTHLKLP